jgi:hypothetical protein
MGLFTSPSNQRTLSTPRVPLDPLPRQAGLFRDLSDAHGFLSQHVAHLVELLARVARLAAVVSAVATPLRMLDAGPLRRLGGLTMRARSVRHGQLFPSAWRPSGPLAPCIPWHPWAAAARSTSACHLPRGPPKGAGVLWSTTCSEVTRALVRGNGRIAQKAVPRRPGGAGHGPNVGLWHSSGISRQAPLSARLAI